MKIVAVSSTKGGAGKSTLTANLAVAAAVAGKTVTIINADPQRSIEYWSQHRLGNPKLVSIPVHQWSGDRPTIQKLIEQKCSSCDLVFIDTTGAACVGTVKALTVADLILVPITPNPEDVECFEMESVQFFEAIPGAENKIGRLIINRMDARWYIQNFFKGHLEALLAKYAVCKTRLGSRVDYVNARAEGKGVIEFNHKGKAASEITDLYAELAALL